MIKRVLTVGLLGLVAWWFYRKYQDINVENYLIESNDSEDINGFLNASFTIAESTINFMNSNENQNLTPSIRLLNFLKSYEQLRLQPYFATEYEKLKGIKTIGYGHLILPSESFDDGITKEEAESLFINDVSKHIEQIYTQIKVPLNQQQFDALTSFCFNLGANCLISRKSARGQRDRINTGDYDEAANGFMLYVKQGGQVVQGLYNRRYSEFKIWKFGNYERYDGI